MNTYNQLDRYGAIAKAFPIHTGKTFFLVSATEATFDRQQQTYPGDQEGQTRVFTTWAAVITACEQDTGADLIVVSPLFTTTPTLAQINSLKAAGVTTIQAGNMFPDGSYLATKAAAALDTATTTNLFQVNGKVRILNILGEAATAIGATASGGKFQIIPTVGSTTDLCATANIASLAIGGQVSITGTLATVLTVSVQGGIVDQAAAVVVKAGTLAFNVTQTTTGNIRYSVIYKPMEPGAFVSAL